MKKQKIFDEFISSYKTLNYYDEIFKQKFKKTVSQEFENKNTSLVPEEWKWDKHNKIRDIGIVRSKISASIQYIEICFNDIANSVDNFSYLFHKEFYETLTLPSNITIVLHPPKRKMRQNLIKNFGNVKSIVRNFTLRLSNFFHFLFI